MQPRRRLVAVLAGFAAAGSGLALVPLGSTAAAAGSFCSVNYTAGTTITWTGKGDGHSWTDASNWSPNTVPDRHQTTATYQTQYVCIGDGKGSKPADVTIGGTDAFHIAGVDVGDGATLTIKPGGRLFLGAATGDKTVASSVDKRSTLDLDASTLGGNATLTVHGTMKWTGAKVKGHKLFATQTSSECVFDPSTKGCPGDTKPGGGATVIAAGGKLLVNGTSFGGTELTASRVITLFGSATFSGNGYVSMGNHTELFAEPKSTLRFDGTGGIYREVAGSVATSPIVIEEGNLVRDGGGTNTVVVGVPVSFGSRHPSFSVLRGAIVINRNAVPKSPVHRGGQIGVGSCAPVTLVLCKQPEATAAAPEGVVLATSSEAGSPKVNHVGLKLRPAPATLHGHRTLGRAVEVSAATAHTTHSTHLTFDFDATTPGVTSKTSPIVYRNSHKITLCRVHGLTAKNTSCIFFVKHLHGGAATKGDLELMVITIQPDAKWVVAR
ncbi:MAG TPA: hypothetical protein VME70_08590 [Mycobacteriales bacterium]|nr:hypothetical protein [Mycobacteriales bacterium]